MSTTSYPTRDQQLRASGATAIDLERRMMRMIARIRCFEQKLLQLFSEGKLAGTTHTCIGQEACAAALYEHIDQETDAVFANHRCHGHFLAYGGSMRALLAEIMGKHGGVCSGRGGSQHLCYRRFFSQGIQGAGMPMAAGYAWLLKRRETNGLVVAHIGDGTLGEGLVYETLNIAQLQKIPLLVVLENNGVAQSTSASATTAGVLEDRFRAFGCNVDRRRAGDPVALADHFAQVTSEVRRGSPFVQILDTYRLMAHSKGDDDRPQEEVQLAWKNDFFAARLAENDPLAVSAWEDAVREVETLASELNAASDAPWDDRAEVYAPGAKPLSRESLRADVDSATERINECLGDGLRRCLKDNRDLLVLGEDIADPYGGAFKVTRGLTSEFPDQVFSTPISEAAIVGFANGVGLAGGSAIAEIMFGDFATLAVDQLVNQAAKMHFMYAGQVSVPVVVRLPSGGYRGYGPTHSQSLERMFCGVPGLKVVALSRRHNPAALLEAASRDPNPVLLVENKSLYSLRPLAEPPRGFRLIDLSQSQAGDYPPLMFSSTDEDSTPADCTVVAYGGLTDMVEQSLVDMILQHEWDFDYFILTQLNPLDVTAIRDSAARTKRLVTVEEAATPYGVGAEVASAVAEQVRGVRIQRIGALPTPIPNSRTQELATLPTVESIVSGVQRVFDQGPVRSHNG